MDYISKRKKLTNEPYYLSDSELRDMMDQNERDRLECLHVTESTYRGESYYKGDGRPGDGKVSNSMLAFFKEVTYRDPKTDGFVMTYPYGTVIQQGKRSSYFRGENQIYKSSQPTIHRKIEHLSDCEKSVYLFVNSMRIAEFKLFIDRFDILRLWTDRGLSVLYEPLAQHYGIETKWLDITSDLDVALFFANCQYDNSSKQWLPLTKEDTEKSEETKYGVIFHIPVERASISADIKTLGIGDISKVNAIMPIGYQPFMRCHSQHAYGIYMETPNPLQEDHTFEKLYFRHDEAFSREIWEKMGQGRSIYPQEGLNRFDDVLEQIRSTRCFSMEAFDIAIKQSEEFKTLDEVNAALHKCDETKLFGGSIIIGGEDYVKVSRQRIRQFNRKNEMFTIEQNYGIKLISRGKYVP